MALTRIAVVAMIGLFGGGCLSSGGEALEGSTSAGQGAGQTSGGVEGPAISCLPLGIDFGVTPTHSVGSVAVLCTNTGSAVAGTHLRIDPPTASPFAFSAQFDQTKHVYPLNGLAPGQSVQIDVSYAPIAASSDKGTLVITSNGGQVQIPLTGSGLDVPPCQFVISPSAIECGDVPVGSTSNVFAFEIQNVGVDICLVQLAPLTDGFSVVSTSIAPDPITHKITVPVPGPGSTPT